VFLIAVVLTGLTSLYHWGWPDPEPPRPVLSDDEILANHEHYLYMKALQTPTCLKRMEELAREHPNWSAEKGIQWVTEDYDENKCTISGKLKDGTDLTEVIARNEAKSTRPQAVESPLPIQRGRVTPAPVKVPTSVDAESIRVRGTPIRLGDTADEVFQTLKPADSKKKDVGSDPRHPGSLLVTHHYEVEGKRFSLTFSRKPDPGPYRLIRISTSPLRTQALRQPPVARSRAVDEVPAADAVSVSPPPPTPALQSPPQQPVRVSDRIKAPTQINKVQPTYPQIAQSARVQGVVILEATIGVNGKVTDVKVLRSVSLLDQAAIDAVRQWEYTPTLLNDVPTSVIMTVTVTFTLGEASPSAN
jgi:TonB family protein